MFNIDLKHPPKRQKRTSLNPEYYQALKEEVEKLINNEFIREVTDRTDFQNCKLGCKI